MKEIEKMEKGRENTSWWTMALLLAASLVIYLAGTTPALAYGPQGGGPGVGWCGSFPWMAGMGGMGGFGILLNILLLILVIGGVVALLRWTVNNAGPNLGQGGKNSARALDIIKERYARGEIDREEYQRLKEDLA